MAAEETATEEETTPPETEAAPAAVEETTADPAETTTVDIDTGRMSDSEFRLFSDAQSKVVTESLQFSNEVQKCALIGQAGQIAEFSECMDDAYSGFEEDADYAVYLASDTLDDVDKKCAAALRIYINVLEDFAAVVGRAHEVGSQLQFNQMTAAFKQLGPASNRYTRFARNSLGACEPR